VARMIHSPRRSSVRDVRSGSELRAAIASGLPSWSRRRSRRLWLCHDAEHHPATRAVKKDNVCRPLAGHLYSLRDAGNGLRRAKTLLTPWDHLDLQAKPSADAPDG
jgi:hypothetical protein